MFPIITTKVIISSGWSAWLPCSVCMTHTIGLDDTRLQSLDEAWLTSILWKIVANYGSFPQRLLSCVQFHPNINVHTSPVKSKRYMQHLWLGLWFPMARILSRVTWKRLLPGTKIINFGCDGMNYDELFTKRNPRNIWVCLNMRGAGREVCLRGLFPGSVSWYVSGVCFGVCFTPLSSSRKRRMRVYICFGGLFCQSRTSQPY